MLTTGGTRELGLASRRRIMAGVADGAAISLRAEVGNGAIGGATADEVGRWPRCRPGARGQLPTRILGVRICPWLLAVWGLWLLRRVRPLQLRLVAR